MNKTLFAIILLSYLTLHGAPDTAIEVNSSAKVAPELSYKIRVMLFIQDTVGSKVKSDGLKTVGTVNQVITENGTVCTFDEKEIHASNTPILCVDQNNRQFKLEFVLN